MEYAGLNVLLVLLYLLLLVLLLGVAVSLGLGLARRAGWLYTVQRESPLDILKARYARGEITKEQFEAIKRDLM